jgi:PhoPQ-activated pathogenicity-related protein
MLAALALLALASGASAWSFTTALDEYIALPDPTYSYFDTVCLLLLTSHALTHPQNKTITGPGYTAYILNMTSQQWLTYEDSDRSIWWHYVVVVVPDKLTFTTTGAMYITGGDNTDGYPDSSSEDVLLCVDIALTDHVVCTVLFQIPNQPIVFPSDPLHKSRSEDAMVAFTWHHFIVVNQSQPFWLARLPMTKVFACCFAVELKGCRRLCDAWTPSQTMWERSLDTPLESSLWPEHPSADGPRGPLLLSTRVSLPLHLSSWVCCSCDGCSDVSDALNFIDNVHHFWRAYGGWTFALSDYYDLNFTSQIDLPATAEACLCCVAFSSHARWPASSTHMCTANA